MLLNMVTSMFLGDVGVIGCISKVIVPIKQLWLCASVFDLLIFQIVIIWGTYALLLCFHTQMQILCYFWYMGRYNVIWPLQGIHVSIYAHYTVLTCFWNIKLVRPVVCVCVCVLDLEYFAYMLRDVLRYFICCLDLWLSSLLVAFISMCFFLLWKTPFLQARQLLDRSWTASLLSSPSFFFSW